MSEADDKKERILQTPAEIEKALGVRPTDRIVPIQPVTQQDATTPVVATTPNDKTGGTFQGQTTFSAKSDDKGKVAPQVAEPVKPDVTQKQELTPDQKAKMFQQKFSQEETARKVLEQKLAVLQQQFDFVNNFVTNMQYSQMAQQTTQPATEKKVEIKEPQITDFIPDYDESEGVSTTDPRYHKYINAARRYDREVLRNEIKDDVTTEIKRETRLNKVIENGEKFCEVYPEYRLPNGKPNWVKIKQDLGELADTGDFIRAKKFIDFEQGNTQQVSDPNTVQIQNPETILDQVEKIANQQKIPSVSAASQVSDTPVDQDKISDDVAPLKRIFGRV